jgi:UDP-N-acetylmuramoyl-L-alanyl-D-glutamate--2,6-diaminopimelate ligase
MRRLGDLGLGDAITLGPGADPGLVVTGLSVDSRSTRPGHLFAALAGVTRDGAAFVPAALAAGAVAVLTSLDGALRARALPGGEGATYLVVDDPRRALARAAARFSGAQPATVTAVTGTNGKTSAASFTRQIWTALGRRAANLGTTGVEGAVSAPLTHTTPEPIELHALLADLAAQGVTHAAMETSSHGLAQRRADGVRFAAGALTNVTRDHMDYHRDHADYAAAKLGLFARVLPEGAAAVVNADDPVFAAAADVARARGLRLIPVGARAEGGLRLLGSAFHAGGQTLRFSWEGGPARTVELALVGDFQASNALIAAGLAIGAGEAPEAVFGALAGLRGVRGRMERAATRANGAAIYVDYAHTPDALATAIDALRAHVAGRIVVVFGAGGDRDAGKRPLMGAAVAARADAAIVTDDNPRSEDPAAIRAAIRAAIPHAAECGDRAEAIRRGAAMLGPGDALLIAGKGHETGQAAGGVTLPFDDAAEARAAAAALDGEPG